MNYTRNTLRCLLHCKKSCDRVPRIFSTFSLTKNGRGKNMVLHKSQIKCGYPIFFQHLQHNDSTIHKIIEDRANGICWKCRKVISADSEFFCENCQAILPPPDTLTYFDILGIKEQFDVSVVELQEKFKEMQRKFHPDKHSQSTETEKEISELLSSLVNQSYNTLLSPLRRAVYMLELKGIFIEEDTQLDDIDFLMEVMEINEKIADADSDDDLIKARDNVISTCNKLIPEISNALAIGELEHAKKIAIKLRYYENMQGKLKELIPPS